MNTNTDEQKRERRDFDSASFTGAGAYVIFWELGERASLKVYLAKDDSG